MDLRPFFLSAMDNTARIVAGIKPEQMTGETPCGDWDVRTLTNHLVAGMAGMARVLNGEALDPRMELPDMLGDDAVIAYKTAGAAAAEAWSAEDALNKTVSFGREMESSMLLRIALMESVVHGWDLAKATGQEHGIEPMVAIAMLQGLQMTITDESRAGIFDPAVEVSKDAPPEEQLVAFLGRKP